MPVKKRGKKDVENIPPPTNVPEPVVLQLPIQNSRLEELMTMQDMAVFEYNPVISDPQPYIPQNNFACDHDVLTAAQVEAPQQQEHSTDGTPQQNAVTQNASDNPHATTCFWCCHPIHHIEYGMPVRYDVFHKNFTMFGSFCSLECAAAYNYSVHMGSDRVWEIHSWIQMLAHRYGYTGVVRPAPSRYLLKMFGGPLGIDEYRSVHKTLARTCVMNIPPFIHVTSQMEVLNTSFLDKTEHADKLAKSKKKSAFIVEKRTIEST